MEALASNQVPIEDKTLTVWLVIYNSDPDQAYLFTDVDQLCISVVRAATTYVDPMGEGDCSDLIEGVVASLNHGLQYQYFPMRISQSLSIAIYKLGFDKFHSLHRLVLDTISYLDKAGDDTAKGLSGRLARLFWDEVSLSG